MLTIAFSPAISASESAGDLYDFALQETSAAEAFRQFSEISGKELLYASEIVRGVQTRPVQGRYTAPEAIRIMLTDTGLASRQEGETGAFVITRQQNRTVESEPVRPQNRPVNPSPTATEDETVFMSPFEITVTPETGLVNQGIIPRQENQALRYEILRRDDIERSGATDLAELFRQVSAAANFGTGTQAIFGSQMATIEGINTTSDEVNLRGLGSANTLVMINGRRIYDSENAGADISRIPISAIERIEILPGSGSAIYGASATAGVINIVLRKGYSGTDVTVTAGATTRGGAEEFRFSLNHGRTLQNGITTITFGLDYHKRWGLRAGQRKYYEAAFDKVDPANATAYISNIVQNFFGPRGTVTAGGPLNIPSNPSARFAAVPPGATGDNLTLVSFNPTAGTANITSDRVAQGVLIPETVRYSLRGTLEHAFRGDDLTAYVNVNYGYMDRAQQEYVGLLGALTMVANNPNNPFTRAIQVYTEPLDLPPTVTKALQRSYNVVVGLRGQNELLQRKIKWAVDGSWSRNDSVASNIDYTRLVRPAVSAAIYNPLRDMTIVSPLPASEADKYFSQFRRRSTPEITATNLRANGLFFEAWGGDALFSIGSELRFENQFISSVWDYGEYASLPVSGARPSSELKTFRRALALYGETTIPFVGERNRKPLVFAFDVSAAIRYEKYDDFGSAAPPMLAVRYAPVSDVIFRASWSRGFQPPRQNQLFSPQNVTGPLTSILFSDPLRPGLPLEPYFLISGGNPDLKPETSDSYDLGIVVRPGGLPGMTVSASYFRYKKSDLVRAVDRQDAINNPDLFPGRVTRREATPEEVAQGIPGAILEIDTSFTNISRQLVDGWDFNASYRFLTDSVGAFTLRTDATYTMSYREQLRQGLPYVDSVGDIGFSSSVPLRWRGRASTQWEIGRWSTTLAGRYIHSYVGRTNNPTPEVPTRLGLDGDKIPSSLEYDLMLTYSFPENPNTNNFRSWMEGARVSLSILNIADKRPPLRTERSNQFYSLFNDPRQRFISLSIRKSF